MAAKGMALVRAADPHHLHGLTVTIIVFFAFQDAERSRMHAEFQNVAADRAQAIRAEVAEDATELDLVASYLNASQELSEDRLSAFSLEFGRFVRRIPNQEPDTQVVALVSRVPAAERQAFEVIGTKEFASSFRIMEMDSSGEIRAAGRRSVYYPVTVIEPLEHTMTLVGLDLQSVPALKAAIDHAVASGRVTASSSVRLPSTSGSKPVIWYFLTVYRAAGSGGATAARGQMIGIAALAFRVDVMIDFALRDISPAGIDLEILDLQAPQGQQVLYYRKAKIPGYEVTPSVRNWLSWSTTIDAGERTWTIRAYPTIEFMIRHRSWQSWILLAGGLLLTAMGSLYFPAACAGPSGWNPWSRNGHRRWRRRSQSTRSWRRRWPIHGHRSQARWSVSTRGTATCSFSTRSATCSSPASPRTRRTR